MTRGGGHSGTEWLLIAKGPHKAEAVNAKIWGWSIPLKAKGGGERGVNFKLMI